MRARGLLALAGAAALLGGSPVGAQRPAPAPPPEAEPVALNCDAITFKGALDPATVKELEPIHTLDGVAAILTKRRVTFTRGKGVVTVALPDKVRSEIDGLPQGEPIILPARDGGVVCVLIPSADSI